MNLSAVAKRRRTASSSKHRDSPVCQTTTPENVTVESSRNTHDDLVTVEEGDQNDDRSEDDEVMWQNAPMTTKRHWNASADDAQYRRKRQCQCTGCEHVLEDGVSDERKFHNHKEIARIAQSAAPSTSLPGRTYETSGISAARSDNRSVLVSSNQGLHDPLAGLELTLKENDTITLLGQYDIWVRRGCVALLGAILQSSAQLHRVHAPSTHSLPTIKCPRLPSESKVNVAELTIYSSFTGIHRLGKHNRRFRGIWGNFPLPGPRSFQIVESMNQTLEMQKPALDADLNWRAIVDKIVKGNMTSLPVILVCGAKGSGKSTLTRFLCNHLQSAESCQYGVGLLDLDPGQPEFSPPAEISLIHLKGYNLGTPFSHPVVGGRSGQVIRRHYLGTPNPRDENSHYIKSSQDLFQHYEKTMGRSGLPLVINSCGWVQGSGLDALLALVRSLRPTDIILLETDGISDAIHSLEEVSGQVGSRMQTCRSRAVISYSARTASDLREMQTFSYFHLARSEHGLTRWTSNPASFQEKLQLSYSEPEQIVNGILLLGDEINFDLLEDAIVGTVLALVAIEDTSVLIYRREDGSASVDKDIHTERYTNSATRNLPGLAEHANRARKQVDIEADSSRYTIYRNTQDIPYLSTNNGINRPLDPSKTCSLGQVLVQTVDRQSERFTVITPIQMETVQRYKKMKVPLVLVRGRAGMASWSYLENHHEALFATKTSKRSERHRVEEQRQQPESSRSDYETDHCFNLGSGQQKRQWVEFKAADGSTRRNKVWRVRRNLAT